MPGRHLPEQHRVDGAGVGDYEPPRRQAVGLLAAAEDVAVYGGTDTQPAGVDPVGIVAQLGDVWKGWGWHVTERDGFRKPNRFGYAPDGYILQILAKDPVTDPPTLKGDSPCFSGDLPDNRSPFPMVLKAD